MGQAEGLTDYETLQVSPSKFCPISENFSSSVRIFQLVPEEKSSRGRNFRGVKTSVKPDAKRLIGGHF